MALRTYAGPEIGVASTKAFTCQLAALACLALLAAKQRGHLSTALEQELVGALVEAPRHMSEILKQEKHIAGVAREISHAKDVLYLGRGINYPIATGRGPEAQGNFLYPCGRLCGGRIEARTHCTG